MKEGVSSQVISLEETKCSIPLPIPRIRDWDGSTRGDGGSVPYETEERIEESNLVPVRAAILPQITILIQRKSPSTAEEREPIVAYNFGQADHE